MKATPPSHVGSSSVRSSRMGGVADLPRRKHGCGLGLMRRKEITEEQLDLARAMRAETPRRGWKYICKELDIPDQKALRKRLEPGYRERINAKQRERDKKRDPKRLSKPFPHIHHIPDLVVVPAYVIAERDAAINKPRTLTAIAFGDPLPGRRAIDKRGMHETDKAAAPYNPAQSAAGSSSLREV